MHLVEEEELRLALRFHVLTSVLNDSAAAAKGRKYNIHDSLIRDAHFLLELRSLQSNENAIQDRDTTRGYLSATISNNPQTANKRT